jgi:hypothetical protein
MYRYDPAFAPNAQTWLALGEFDRIESVEKHHRIAKIKLPNVRIHAAVHSVVENQIAEGHEPVIRAMKRLIASGLSRHDALHAIGSVLAEHLFDLLKDSTPNPNVMSIYDAAIERLTVENWHSG